MSFLIIEADGHERKERCDIERMHEHLTPGSLFLPCALVESLIDMGYVAPFLLAWELSCRTILFNFSHQKANWGYNLLFKKLYFKFQ